MDKDKEKRIALACNEMGRAIEVELTRLRNVGFSGSLDSKRSSTAWCEYGYPEKIDFNKFFNLYSRGGVAFGAVEKLIGNCWSTYPQIIQGEEADKAVKLTAWESKVKNTLKPVKFWKAFEEADRRRMVGRYSAMILRIADNGTWDQPATSGRLIEMLPVWQSAITPGEVDKDQKSENYGRPMYWQYTPSDETGAALESVKIHHSRVFILGDYSKNAIGFLEPAFNNFLNVEKVEGGSGESFLKNAARHLVISFDKDVKLNDIAKRNGVTVEDIVANMNEDIDRLNKSMDAAVVMQGGTATPLVAAVPDPKPTYEINMMTISASVNIPMKILVGSQSGERASTEDRHEFNARCQSRRERTLSEEIEAFLNKMIGLKIIDEQAEFTVLWDDLTEASFAEKLANAKIMSDINKTNFEAGNGQLTYTEDEIREQTDLDPKESDPDPLPDEDPDTPPGAAPGTVEDDSASNPAA